MAITYNVREGKKEISVKIEGRIVGTIKILDGGKAEYVPKGHKKGGEVFPSVRACQRALEAEE